MSDLPDTISIEECPEELQFHLNSVRDMFNEKKEVDPFLINVDPKAGKLFYTPVGELMQSQETKGVLSELMVEMVKQGSSAVILTTESWMVAFKDDKDGKLSETGKKALKDSMKGTLHQNENRVEILMVNYQCDGRQILCTAEIKRKKRQNREKVTLQEWRIMQADLTRFRIKDVEGISPEEQKALKKSRFQDLWLQAFPERYN